MNLPENDYQILKLTTRFYEEHPDPPYLAEGNAYRSDPKIIHKEATIKMLLVLSGDKNVDDTEEILKALDIAEEDEISMCELFDQYTRRGISEKEAEEQMKLYW